MRVERRNGYRVVVGGPVPPQADAITLGKTIVMRAACAEREGLLAHELVHVRQFADRGVLRFLLRYVGSYLSGRLSGYGHMAAYRRIPLEVEACWLSRLHRVDELEPCAQPPGQTRPRISQAALPPRLAPAPRQTADHSSSSVLSG